MQSFKHYWMFVKMNMKQIRRKWLTFLLLLLFPMLLVGAILWMTASIFTVDDQEVLRIGLVDQDQSKETEMIVQVLAEAADLGPLIEIEMLTEHEAIAKIEVNQLASYIIFPEAFTKKLYTGESVQLQMVGNPRQKIESAMVKEIIDSVMRHINTSQANILLINHYAKAIYTNNSERNDYLFEQFLSFLLYALSKDNVLASENIVNQATASTTTYYSISALFMFTIIWLFMVYHFLHREQSERLIMRMKLYGVTESQQILARLTVTFLINLLLIMGLFVVVQQNLKWTLAGEDYRRIAIVWSLFSVIFLQLIATIELLVRSEKMRLLIQSIVTGAVIVLSGAIVPTLYFPIYIQKFLSYVFSAEAFYWLLEVLLNERFYADYKLLLISAICGLIIVTISAFWKGRVKA